MSKNKVLIFISLILFVGILIGIFFNFNKNNIIDSNTISDINQLNEDDIILGDYDAKLTIIMYFDYNCTFCKKFFNETYPQIETNYLKTGKAKLVLRLICNPKDKQALKAYQTVVCINKFGHFEDLHQLLLYKNEIIYSRYLQELIDEYTASNSNVAECLFTSNNLVVKQNIQQFQELKTQKTPTFIINNDVVIGYKDYDYFRNILN